MSAHGVEVGLLILRVVTGLGTGFAGIGAGVTAAAVAALTPLMPRRLGSPG